MKKLIVIEGALDGIGKSTQYNKLKERLERENIKVFNHHFPSYNTNQGTLVEEYLKGEYGKPQELSPYFINSLYAVDRAVTMKTKFPALEANQVILLDRYTTSSLIYQSALIENLEERKTFIDYVCDFEYNKLGLPKPDNVIFLYAPFEEIAKLRNKRKQEVGEAIEGDIHENDLSFMKKVYENAVFVAKYLDFTIINCTKNGSFRQIDDIASEIYDKIKTSEYDKIAGGNYV